MLQVFNQIDALNREVWRFQLITNNTHQDMVSLVVSDYSFQFRETKRHGWKRVQWYDRFDRRRTIKETDVPLPEWVMEKARELITIEVRV